MSKIKVQNFGPINEGLNNSDFINFNKVTLLIGNQATGKSSIAKLFSTMTWLEKALIQGDLKASYVTKYNRFVKNYCAYQGIKNYFRSNTEIEYYGDAYILNYKDGKLSINNKSANEGYLTPKIMYVPAERNFLSVVEEPQKIKYLPLPLYTFLDEFERSKSELNNAVGLPINNVKFEYQKQNKISYIKGQQFKLRLHEASSGIQSLLPVFLVSRNLAYSIIRKNKKQVKQISVEQEKRIREDIEKIIKNNKISEDIKEILLERLSRTYENQCFINIVEEIEQNLFPSSQQNLLNELLSFNNLSKGNKLILTSHSPYILNYLTLAIKGYTISNILSNGGGNLTLKDKLERVVPSKSCISPSEVNIYEFTDNGEIRLLPNYNGIPSDDNYLNTYLFQTNELFNNLLEIEDELL